MSEDLATLIRALEGHGMTEAERSNFRRSFRRRTWRYRALHPLFTLRHAMLVGRIRWRGLWEGYHYRKEQRGLQP